MSHKNKIVDTETHFVIDPHTRRITTAQTSNNTLVQYDHNSERFTFEIPRYVDGHDMYESDEVRIHYRNGSSNSLSKTNGVYTPDDLAISEDDDELLTFSWLLSSATTQYIGYLHFSIQFVCLGSDGKTIEYAWNTGIYKEISVVESINNAEAVVVENADAIAALRKELMESVGSGGGSGSGGTGGGNYDDKIAEIEQAIADLNYKEIAITKLTASPSTVEVGWSGRIDFSWATNKSPTVLKWLGNTIDATKTSTYVTKAADNKATTTPFELSASDEKNTVRKSVTVYTYYGVYYGVSDKTSGYDSAFVLGLTKSLQSGRTTTFSANAGSGKYIYFCAPASFGDCTFTVGVLPGGFQKAATISFKNAYGVTTDYNIYRSNNPNLGSKTVVVS